MLGQEVYQEKEKLAMKMQQSFGVCVWRGGGAKRDGWHADRSGPPPYSCWFLVEGPPVAPPPMMGIFSGGYGE